VTAASGNGTVLVSWAAPASDGGRPITNYVLTILVNGDTFQEGVGPATSFTFSVVDGLTLAFRVSAENAYGVGPDSPSSGTIVTAAGGADPQVATAPIPPSGGFATTDPTNAGPTPSNPVTTRVSVPATARGGFLSIAETTPGP